MPDPSIYTFECVPVSPGRFDPILFDIPSLSGEDFAARRAYWEMFHLLGKRGIDIDEFQVNEYFDTPLNAGPGRPVGPGGFYNPGEAA